MTDDIRQARRNEAVERLDEIRREIEAEPHLEVEARYRLRLQIERQCSLLRGDNAPQTVTFKSEPVPASIREALADPDPAAGLPADSGASPFELHVEGFSYEKIGRYMVARDRRDRSR